MSFTSVEARAALIDILSAFQSQTNLPGLEAARAEAGNDMVKQMQLVFPAVTRIQAQVISRYVIFCNNLSIQYSYDHGTHLLFIGYAGSYYITHLHMYV